MSMDREILDFSDMVDGCRRAIERLDELDKRAKVNRLKKELKRRSDQICREFGIRPKEGVILRTCEFGGTVQLRKS